MRRLVVVAVGAGLLLVGVPGASASGSAAVGGRTAERDALAVLERAVRAGRGVDYRGTQYVVSRQDARSSSASLVDVTHRPGHGSVLSEAPTAAADPVPTGATAALDPRQVQLLAAAYDLALTGRGRCAGRATSVVEARRDGAVAGRFWVDDSSGLLLRREVYDAGRTVRSSAFVDVEVRAATAGDSLQPAAAGPAVAEAADDLRDQGWDVPDGLPGGFRLFDTRLSTPRPGRHVLHLAYSDGLSTTSLFAQSGRLGTAPLAGFERERVRGRPVWVRHAAPERVVWSGGGHVWTLVSDAPLPTVRSAVAALPRDRAPDEGVRSRVGRGLSRLAGLLDPFS